ncbi:MAG: hypothetical protein GC171_13315 [Terrimonas sp.]|nr:hypothetical protein [Terrimonas sp.]
MELQLIKGVFEKKEILDIITQMVHVKIKFHENKISKSSNEEDIKFRESRIKKLQKQLYEVSRFIESKKDLSDVQSSIIIE